MLKPVLSKDPLGIWMEPRRKNTLLCLLYSNILLASLPLTRHGLSNLPVKKVPSVCSQSASQIYWPTKTGDTYYLVIFRREVQME
uniref:Putative ovule protein n=1 Tax=Solanum chacoense TaxID=4108 RepID=A0A0V0GJB0_SOLCH